LQLQVLEGCVSRARFVKYTHSPTSLLFWIQNLDACT
jgi:hypothetical protein